jgi:hypothetical protein
VIVTLLGSDSEHCRFHNDANLSPLLLTWSATRKCVLMIKIKGSVLAVHAMKAHGRNGVIVKPILNFGTRWRFGLPYARVTLPPGNAPHSAYCLGSWIGPRARMDDLKQRSIFVSAGIRTANLLIRILGTILTAVYSDLNSSYKFLVCVSLFEMLRDWAHPHYHPPTYSQIFCSLPLTSEPPCPTNRELNSSRLDNIL